MKERMEISDMYKTASLICQGAELRDVRVTDKTRILFLLEKEGLFKLESDYDENRLYVKALEFRATLNHLRDLMYGKLSKDKKEALCV